MKFTSGFLKFAGNERLFSVATLAEIDAKINYSSQNDFQLQQLHDIAIKVADKKKNAEICKRFKAHTDYANLFKATPKFEVNVKELPHLCMDDVRFYKNFPDNNSMVADLRDAFLQGADINKLLKNGANIKKYLSAEQMKALIEGKCGDITNVNYLKGLTKVAIKEIDKSCFDSITEKSKPTINQSTAAKIVKHLNDEIIQTVDKRFFKTMMKALTIDQIGKFDKSREKKDEYCEHMHLGELDASKTKKLTPACFYRGLKNHSSTSFLNLEAPFFKNAKADLFSKLDPKEKDGRLLKTLDPNMKSWVNMKEQHVKAILELAYEGFTDDLEKQLDLGLSKAISKLHENPAIEIFHGEKKTLEYLEKWPVSFYRSEKTLEKLGRDIVSKFSSLLEKNGAIELFKSVFFRRAMAPEQFKALFVPYEHAPCWKLDASLLEKVNETTLKSIPVECLSKMKGWDTLTDVQARWIVPNLDEKAFSVVRMKFNEQAIRYLTSAQVAHFDEDGTIRCQDLNPEHLLPQQAPFVDPTCYANAVSAADKVVHKHGFLSRARPELFSTLDASDLAKVLHSDAEWAQLSKDAVDKILARGALFCRILRGPAPGKVIRASAISAACFAEISFDEQLLFINSPMIAVLAEDALKTMHVPSSTTHEGVVKLFKRIALARPALMAPISTTPEGPHVCSVLSVLRADTDLGSASKHVPDHCYKEMQDLDKVSAADLSRLSAGAAKAIDLPTIAEKIDFSSYKSDDWTKLSPAICKLISRPQFEKVKKDQAISAMSGVCISELSVDLAKDEIGKVGIVAIAGTSETFVARYYKLFSLAQFGALGTNAKGIISFADVSAEHIGALTPTAMKSIQPSAFATLDLPKFLAIEPGATEVITLAQISQVKPEIVVKLNADQAKHLGKLVTDKNQNPKLLFGKELYEQLDPKTKEFIEPSAAINLRVGIVPMVIAAACVLIMA